MTTPNQPGGPTYASDTTTTYDDTGQSGAKDQAKQAASQAAGESKHVADVAKSEAQTVAREAQQQARGLLDDAKMQLDDQSRTQRDRLVETLRKFSDDLEQMASQGGRSGMATDLSRQVAGKARDMSTRLDGREPSELLDEVRSFARRRPGTFLLGAVAAGVFAGRLTRGAKDAQSQQGMRSSDRPVGTSGMYTDAGPAPGTTYPNADPSYQPSTATGDPLVGVAPADGIDEPGRRASSPGTHGTNVADQPWTDDPMRRGMQ